MNGTRNRCGSGAVILGADYRGLGVVRSLGRHGVPVWVVQVGEDRQARMSKYAQRTLRMGGRTPEQLPAFLVELGKQEALEGWTLFPTSDQSAAPLSRQHAALSRIYRMTVPAWPTFSLGHDKRRVYKLADELRIDHPRTFVASSRESLLSAEITPPFVLKPAYHESSNRLSVDKAWRAEDQAQLLRLYEEACEFLPPDALMVQELIPGNGASQVSFAAACIDGRPVASVTAARLRQYPMDFGRASTYVISTDAADVAEAGSTILRHLGITGLAEVEFKRDSRSGALKLLDVNLRVWAWHTLGEAVDVPFSYLLWRVLNGLPVREVRIPPGVRWMRMSVDLPTAVRELLGGRLSLRDYAHSFGRPRTGASLARDDILPALSELPALGHRVALRVARGGRP